MNNSRILKEYDELLNEYDFFRVHHSHLINLDYVERFVRTDGTYVVMAGGEKIPIAKRKRERFIQRLSDL